MNRADITRLEERATDLRETITAKDERIQKYNEQVTSLTESLNAATDLIVKLKERHDEHRNHIAHLKDALRELLLEEVVHLGSAIAIVDANIDFLKPDPETFIPLVVEKVVPNDI